MFIAANLAIGLFFSTLAKTQQQAMQMSFFFLLPNIEIAPRSSALVPSHTMWLWMRHISRWITRSHWARSGTSSSSSFSTAMQ